MWPVSSEPDGTKEDFTANAQTYDLIFDIVGATTFHRCQHLLKPHGVFLQNIMGLTDIVRILWTAEPDEDSVTTGATASGR